MNARARRGGVEVGNSKHLNDSFRTVGELVCLSFGVTW